MGLSHDNQNCHQSYTITPHPWDQIHPPYRVKNPHVMHLLTLYSLDEYHQSSLQHNELDKKWSKATFEHQVNLPSFNEGDVVLAYDIVHDTLSHGKFESLWHGSFII
jgi:hypothetical protein